MESAASSTPGSNLPAVKQQGAALAVPGATGEGFGDVHARDVMVPDLRIGQGTTRIEGIVAGKFYSSLDPTHQKERVHAVALSMSHGQAYFPRDKDGKPIFDAPLVCGSSDAVVPMPSIEKPIAPICRDARGDAVCPAAKWSGSGGAPVCQEVHRWAIVDLEDGIPYRLSLRRTDIKTSKKFLTNLLFKARPHGLSMHDFTFVLSTVRHQTPDGVWYTAAFGDVQRVATVGMHRGLYQQFGGASKVDAADSDDEGGEATGGTAAAKASEQEKPAAPAADPQSKSATSAAPPHGGKTAKGRQLDFT